MGNSKYRDFLRRGGSERWLAEVFVRGTKRYGGLRYRRRGTEGYDAESYMVVCISVGSVRLG
jgi:hypothetical protein